MEVADLVSGELKGLSRGCYAEMLDGDAFRGRDFSSVRVTGTVLGKGPAVGGREGVRTE